MASGTRAEGCALVTGSARGIGKASAAALAADGWPVALNYRSDADGAKAVAEAIGRDGGQAQPVQAEVRDPDAVSALFKEVAERLKRSPRACGFWRPRTPPTSRGRP